MDLNRNRRRWIKRRRSASACVRLAVIKLREAEVLRELGEAERQFQRAGRHPDRCLSLEAQIGAAP